MERAAKYLKDVVGISGFKADQSWEYITTTRDCRNMVVHNGGRIKDDLKPKCDKFNIEYNININQHNVFLLKIFCLSIFLSLTPLLLKIYNIL